MHGNEMVRRTFSLLSSNLGEATRWCIKSLAELNNKKLVLLEESFINASNASFRKQQRPSLSPSLQNRPSRDVAKILLQEICIRLKRQNEICADMISHVESEAMHDEVDRSNLAATDGKRSVIKAVNSPLRNFKDQNLSCQVVRREEQKSLKLLQNLQRLHTDTHQLAMGLIHGPNTVCQRFNKADQTIVEAVMEQIRSRHANTVEDLADVVLGLRKASDLKQHHHWQHDSGHKDFSVKSNTNDNSDDYHDELLRLIDSFLRGRNGVQLLCDHYIGFCKGRPHGAISANVNVWDVTHEAFLEAQHLCDANHGFSPELAPHPTYNNTSAPFLHVIRPWVYHSLVEIFKNAMTSSVEKSKRLSSEFPSMTPSIQVQISQNSDEQLTFIHVIDEGVGLNDHSRRKAFSFAETSQSRRWDRLQDQQSYAAVRAPLASLGVGLPLSRTMMRMFGGDITLLENKNHGCTATLILSTDPTILEYDDSTRKTHYSQTTRCLQ